MSTQNKPRRKSPKVTAKMAAKMRKMLNDGWLQHDIAAKFGVNQGRVSEAKNGLR